MIFLLLIGAASGIVSGMGIGGGAILIPSLTFLFGYQQQAAQHINLIYFIPTAIIALITHSKEGNIEKGISLKIILFGLLGAFLGSMLAIRISPDILKKIFGGFLLIMGIIEFRKR